MQWISIDYLPKKSDFCSTLSARYPTLLVARWSNNGFAGRSEVLEFFCREPIVMRHVRADLAGLAKMGRVQIMTDTVTHHDTIIAALRIPERKRTGGPTVKAGWKRGVQANDDGDALEILGEFGSLALMPVTYERGWARYRIIAIKESLLPKMFKLLQEAGRLRVTTRIPIHGIPVEQSITVSTSELFSKVTTKQGRALLAALELGYFRVPRGTRYQDMSDLAGMPRTTFETHVRKAESKILGLLTPYIAVHFGQARQKATLGREERPFPEALRRSQVSGHLTAEPFYRRRGKVSKEVRVMSEELFNAIKEGDDARVEQMISRNPSLVNTKDSQGMSPVTVATYYGRSKIAEVLVLRGAKLTLYEASMTGKLETVKDIITRNPEEARSFSSDGFTALHLAAFFGRLEIVRYLLDAGAEVNGVAKNMMKVMPLHSAVARNQLEISELLIGHGAEVNAKQQGGFAPLHEAAQSGNLKMARLLLKHGAEVNVKSSKGKTPLALTREEGPEAGDKEGRERVARFLIEKGAV